MSKKILMLIIALALVAAGAAGYYKFYKKDNVNNNDDKATSEQAQNKIDLPELPQDLKELKVTVVKEGSGAEIQKGNIAYVMYVGVLPDGNVFDSNVQSGQPIGFPIGEGAVIKGWDEALVGVKEGTEVIIDVPADMAYGEAGIPGRIPPNSPLRFDVFVVKVMTKEEAQKLQEEAKKAQESSQADNAAQEGQ